MFDRDPPVWPITLSAKKKRPIAPMNTADLLSTVRVPLTELFIYV